MIASSASRWAIRGRPVAAGGSDSASSGATTAHSAAGTRQIGGSAGRAFFGRAITHLPRVVPHDLFPSEIDTKTSISLLGTLQGTQRVILSLNPVESDQQNGLKFQIS